ncbi:ROK family protein [Actinoplanes sp. NPDC051861]|uniref:ROK family protein n=1 Tax=Actinoplanes sp. NPDC051861 TaxID=3155170 RepID=UPI0034466FDD
MKTQRADFTDVRATNLAVVLRHLRVNGPSSRAAIAASTGLNKATVSSLTSDLIDQRLLRETGLTGNRIGRPSTALALDGSAYAAIGLQVTADRLTALAVDYAGEQLLLWHRVFEKGRVSAITALAQRAASRVRQQGRHVLGLTVAVPGFDRFGADLGGVLSGSLRQPDLSVAVANHTGLAAVAELRHGGYPDGTNLAYVTAAAGIEAGLVVDGRLLPDAGRIGRFSLGPAGAPTLEDLAGVGQLVRRVLQGADPESLADLSPAVEQVTAQARAGDTGTLAALDDTGRYLGQGLALVANLVNPEVIALGDHYAALATWLVPAAEAEMARHTESSARLVASALGLHAAALGGAVAHLDRIDTGELPAHPRD